MNRIIILNGTSSVGKSTIVAALRPLLPDGFCYFASDQLADAGFRAFDKGPLERERFFDGFHRAIAGFAMAGNDMVVEHIIETQAWADDLARLLAPFDVFWVGVHAPLTMLEAREAARGDRATGEAAYHMKTHGFCRYDLEVENVGDAADCAQKVAQGWATRF